MAYEFKIFCGILYDTGGRIGYKNLTYFKPVAMIDLCAVPDIKPHSTGVPIYFYDQGVETFEDSYNTRLRAIPVAQMLEIVNKARLRCPDYRRWKPAIALLESLLDFPDDDIYCFVYGY